MPDGEATWSDGERWVWAQTLAGGVADFDAPQSGSGSGVGEAAPQDRILRPCFLRAILADAVSEKVPHRGIRIAGAHVVGPLDLSDVRFGRPVLLERMHFRDGLDLRRAVLGGLLSLSGSKVFGSLNLNGSKIAGDLLLDGATLLGPTSLAGAQAGGAMILDGTTFSGDVDMGGVVVGRGLSIRNQARFHGGVSLVEAVVGHNLDVEDSRFDANLSLNGARTGRGLQLRHSVHERDTEMLGVRVGATLRIGGAKFRGKLDMGGLETGESLYVYDAAEFFGEVLLVEAGVGDSLRIGAPHIPGAGKGNVNTVFHRKFDLRGARIGGTLETSEVVFSGRVDLGGVKTGLSLVLGRNTIFKSKVDLGAMRVGDLLQVSGATFDGPAECLPPEQGGDGPLELQGLTYERRGGVYALREGTKYGTWPDWLALDVCYTAQPYRQLAKVLREEGQFDDADDVLYRSRDRERDREWEQGHWGRWLWLSALKWTIGYGLGAGYLLAAIPLVFFTVVGTVVLKRHPGTRGRSWYWCAGASFDEILPLVELNEEHGKVISSQIDGVARAYFYFHRVVAFLLGSFLAAGLAGLTQGT